MSVKKDFILKLGHIDIEVSAFTSDIQESSDARGISIKDYKRIYIDKTIPPAFQGEVLLHELLHHIWDYMNLKNKSKEEVTVDALAKGLCTVIKDNPNFIKILTNALNGKDIPVNA